MARQSAASRRRMRRISKGRQTIKVAKGLERREACRRAGNRATRDWRGCKYDPRTGKVTLV